MINYNVEEKDLRREVVILTEHIKNNSSVRSMLGKRRIKLQELSPSEDIKKLERRIKSKKKKTAEQSRKFSGIDDEIRWRKTL